MELFEFIWRGLCWGCFAVAFCLVMLLFCYGVAFFFEWCTTRRQKRPTLRSTTPDVGTISNPFR